MSHARAHDFGHSESVSFNSHLNSAQFTKITFRQSFSVRRQIYGPSGHDGRNVYFTLAFAGVALMAAVFVGVAVAKYRASRSPHAQGFVEVDQVIYLKWNLFDIFSNWNCFSQTVAVPVTPEERHVANMQINGYENPTYKYFEVKE